MTQLISADSLVTSRIPARGQRNRLTDPDARKSFEVLATILSNPTRIYFAKVAAIPEAHSTPLMAMWVKRAAEEGGRVVLPSISLAGLNKSIRGETMADAFHHFLGEPGVPARLTRWAKFQLTDDRLFAVYENGRNKLDDVRHALSFLDESPSDCIRSFRRRLQGQSLRMCDAAVDHSSGMSQDRFVLGYIFWAFMKGFQYVAKLSSNSKYAYLVHWLRLRAMFAGTTAEEADTEVRLARLFPWGIYLSSLVGSRAIPDRDSVSATIASLKSYTADRFSELDSHIPRDVPRTNKSLKDVRRRVWHQATKFGRDGLLEAVPSGLEKHLSACNIWFAAGYVASHLLWPYSMPDLLHEVADVTVAKTARRLPAEWLEPHTTAVRHIVRLVRYRRDLLTVLRQVRTNRALARFIGARTIT